jgi:hypothetical protein
MGLGDPVPESPLVHADRAATSAMLRCSSSTIAASRWNSGGYFEGRPLGRFLLDMDFLLYEVSAQRGMVTVRPADCARKDYSAADASAGRLGF